MPNNYELGNEDNVEDTPHLEADTPEPALEQGWTPAMAQAEAAQKMETADDPSAVFDAEEPLAAPETSESVEAPSPEEALRAGSLFLHERNTTFHSSAEVEGVVGYLRTGGESIPNEPAAKITAYLDFLADQAYVNDGTLTGDQSSLERQIEGRVIAPIDIPENYFELQRQLAREEGLGDAHFPTELRRRIIETVQTDQRTGFRSWATYLTDDNTKYPDWFKRYALESAAKLSTYDKEKGEFQKRSRGTVAPPPELNHEALAYVFDALNESRIQGGRADEGNQDEEFQKHLRSGNFGGLYAHAMREVLPTRQELQEETRGSWTTFDQSDDPKAVRLLSSSLQGYGTGWCIAREERAGWDLSDGDFHIYYSRGKKDEDTVPRVAIRMEMGEVAEVRGILAEQELEFEMAGIAAKKLQTLPGGEEYARKAADMKRLTTIEKQITANPQTHLNDETLRFLYEVDRNIQGFGHEPDPRIIEIRRLRGDRDKAELLRILPEIVEGQLEATCEAYQAVSDQLFLTAVDRADERQLAELFAQKNAAWKASGVYEYAAEQVIKNGGCFNLLAVPEVYVSQDDIMGLAEDFSRNHWEFASSSELEAHSRRHNALVRFSLVPSHTERETIGKSVKTQIEMLREHQAAHPSLDIHIPSIFDAVAHWYSLRAQEGGVLEYPGLGERTYIRHINAPIWWGGVAYIVRTAVEDFGWPELEIITEKPPYGKNGGIRLAVG